MPKQHPILTLSLCSLAAASAGAQVRVIGSVPISEAATTGALAVSGSKNLLGGDSIITALDRPAHVSLFRGGELLVCQSSVTHLTGGQHSDQLANNMDPLLVSLDRGALELHMPVTRDDALITPDFRFISVDTRDKAAPLNLAIRVTPNGDTCVDNRGRKAPILALTDPFSQASYLLKPGQHVLFEHGSLKEVVDTEYTSCGCPPAQSLSLADAAIRGGSKKKVKKQTEPDNFPTAVSEGLAPAAPLPVSTPGSNHVQVSADLNYDPSIPVPPPPSNTPSVPSTETKPSTPSDSTAAFLNAPLLQVPSLPPSPTQPAQKKGGIHAVGRFFKRIFVR